MADDPFAEFGGAALADAPAADPFAEFGGAALAVTRETDPFAEFGGAALAAGPAARPAPKSNVVTDTAYRFRRGVLAAPGTAIAAVAGMQRGLGEASEASPGVKQWLKEKLFTKGGAEELERLARERGEQRENRPLFTGPGRIEQFGRGLAELARTSRFLGWTPDPAREGELPGKIAEELGTTGTLVALGGAGLGPGGVALGGAAGMGESERRASIEAGLPEEVAEARGRIAAPFGAAAALLPVAAPARGAAGPIERVATKALSGAALNVAVEAGEAKAMGDELTVPRMLMAAGFGSVMGGGAGAWESWMLKRLAGQRLPEAKQTLAAIVADPATVPEQKAAATQALDRLGEMERQAAEIEFGRVKARSQLAHETGTSPLPAMEAEAAQRGLGDVAAEAQRRAEAGLSADAGAENVLRMRAEAEQAARTRAAATAEAAALREGGEPLTSPGRVAREVETVVQTAAAREAERLAQEAQRVGAQRFAERAGASVDVANEAAVREGSAFNARLLRLADNAELAGVPTNPETRRALGALAAITEPREFNPAWQRFIDLYGAAQAPELPAAPGTVRDRLTSLEQLEAGDYPTTRTLPETARVTVQPAGEYGGRAYPGYVSVQLPGRGGARGESLSVATLRGQGYEMPDIPAHVPAGTYSLDELDQAIRNPPAPEPVAPPTAERSTGRPFPEVPRPGEPAPTDASPKGVDASTAAGAGSGSGTLADQAAQGKPQTAADAITWLKENTQRQGELAPERAAIFEALPDEDLRELMRWSMSGEAPPSIRMMIGGEAQRMLARRRAAAAPARGTWSQNIVQREVQAQRTAAAGPQGGDAWDKAKAKLNRKKTRAFTIGLHPSGAEDLLNAIERAGGVPAPSAESLRLETSGEYNGFKDVFTGPAKILVNGRWGKGPGNIDRWLSELAEQGYHFDKPSDLYEAVRVAVRDRQNAKASLRRNTYRDKFDAALMQNTQSRPYWKAPEEGRNVDNLALGDKFKVNAEQYRVTDIDPDGNVTVKDGQERTLPPGTIIFPDRGEVKRPRVKKAGPDPWDMQAGKVNMQALMPFVRAAVGGVIGSAIGDTPEERVENMMLGAGMGAALSRRLARTLVARVRGAPVTAEAARRAGEQWTRLNMALRPQSYLPEEIRRTLRYGEQATRAITAHGESLAADLRKAIRGVGDRGDQGVAAAAAEGYLRGRVQIEDLPAPVRAPAEKLRAMIDELSARAVSEGAVEGPMADTFMDNLGTYLRRSYEIFANPNYRPTEAAKQAAVRAVADAQGVPAAEAEAMVAALLEKHGGGREALGDFLAGRGVLAGKDVGSLVRRKDLLPEIRALLGEIKDPVANVGQTIPRLARLVEGEATQRAVRDIGLRLGLFEKQRTFAKPAQLVSESSRTHDWLRNLYATPEVAHALRREAGTGRVRQIRDLLWRGLVSGTAGAKMAKTVFNPESYAPNLVGGLMMNVANGNFRVDALGRGLQLGAEELGLLRRAFPGSPTRDALRAEITELKRLGVLGDGVNAGDMLRSIDESFLPALSKRATKVFRLPGRAYGAIDDLTRYVAYKSELARYKRAYPGRPEAELRRIAAETVRATMPTYSQIPRWVRDLSTLGVAPSFVNFSWEMYRNTFNSARIGLKDLREGMRTGNRALTIEGAKRLAALTAVLGASSGYGVAQLSRRENRVTDEQEQAVRKLTGPWNEEGILQYHGQVKDGRAQFSNLSYLLPHAAVLQGLESARQEATPAQAAAAWAGSIVKQFTGNSVLLPGLIGAGFGFDYRRGREIPSSGIDPTLGDRAEFLWNEAFKPLGLSWAEKLLKGLRGEKGDYGQEYSAGEQGLRLLGVRSQTVDFGRAAEWKSRELASRFNEATGIFRSRLRQNLPPEKLAAAYEQSEAARRGVFDQLVEMRRLALSTGVKDEQITKALRASHLPARLVLGVLDGQYIPGEREGRRTAGEIFAEMQGRPREQIMAELAALYREDSALAKGVLERAREAGRGVSERDRLILSLGVGDGERAAYLRRELFAMPANQRMPYLAALHKKKILTPAVLKQMAEPGN